MNNLNELDCVISITDLEGIPKGTEGCIVFDYGRDGMYEVEFFDDDKNTIDVIRVHEKDLEKI